MSVLNLPKVEFDTTRWLLLILDIFNIIRGPTGVHPGEPRSDRILLLLSP